MAVCRVGEAEGGCGARRRMRRGVETVDEENHDMWNFRDFRGKGLEVKWDVYIKGGGMRDETSTTRRGTITLVTCLCTCSPANPVRVPHLNVQCTSELWSIHIPISAGPFTSLGRCALHTSGPRFTTPAQTKPRNRTSKLGFSIRIWQAHLVAK